MFRQVTVQERVSGADPLAPPLTAPLVRGFGWAEVQQMSQSAAYRDDELLSGIRATATIRRGTRMVKVLSAAQVAGHLGGWPAYGFCYRQADIAHLRRPAELAGLSTDGGPRLDVAFALRWRAVDGRDYEIPDLAVHPGLTTMPSHQRVGAVILGTGFTPSTDDLIPEFVTAGFADLPLPANTQLLAYPETGEEIVLYTFQPEQRGWLRLAGPKWRHLLAAVPGVSPDREYLPCPDTAVTRLVGRINDHEYEAIADPPSEFRARALTRAARYPVQTLSRRAETASWRGATWWVLERDDRWARLRLSRPDAEAVAETGARGCERGVHEAWALLGDLTEHRTVDLTYEL